MTTLHAGKPEYYRHSGRFDTARTPLAIGGALAAAGILSTIYAYVVLYLPIAGYITFLITWGFGFALGAATGSLLRWAKVRNMPLSIGLALGVGVFAVYWMWIIYLFALLQQGQDAPPLWAIVINPAVDWELIKEINATGVWTVRKMTPSGIFLGLIWVVEAGAVLVLSTWYPMKKMAEMPFCEACGVWGSTRPLASLAAGHPTALKNALEGKNFTVLEQLGQPASEALNWTQVTLQGCANCDTTQTLSVDFVERTFNKEGKASDKLTAIVHQLRLSPEETMELAQTVARVLIPPAAEKTEQPAETPAEEKAQAVAALEKMNEEQPAGGDATTT